MKWPFISDTKKDSSHFIFQVSWETDLFKLVEFYLEDGLEMTIHCRPWGRFVH